MTTREFYLAVAAACSDNDELVTKANELIASLDAKNEKRKSVDSKAKKESAGRRNAVLALLAENPSQSFSRNDIAIVLEISEGQATSACTALVKEGLVAKSEVKIDKAKKVVYSIVTE